MSTYPCIQNFVDKKLVVLELIPSLEELLFEILLSNMIKSGGRTRIHHRLDVNDVRDVPLVVLMLLEQLREIPGVRGPVASGWH